MLISYGGGQECPPYMGLRQNLTSWAEARLLPVLNAGLKACAAQKIGGGVAPGGSEVRKSTRVFPGELGSPVQTRRLGYVVPG
jgi:hypothetical protein